MHYTTNSMCITQLFLSLILFLYHRFQSKLDQSLFSRFNLHLLFTFISLLSHSFSSFISSFPYISLFISFFSKSVSLSLEINSPPSFLQMFLNFLHLLSFLNLLHSHSFPILFILLPHPHCSEFLNAFFSFVM